MEGMISGNDKQSLVSSFLEIAVGQTAETAVQFLQATSWKLEEALQLFYVGNEGGPVVSASHSPPTDANLRTAENTAELRDFENGKPGQLDGGEEVRAPLPVVRDTLYDDAVVYGAARMGHLPHESSSLIAFRNFNEEMKRPGVWESDQSSTSTTDNPRDNLASLYRPPFHLMFHGSFEKRKKFYSTMVFKQLLEGKRYRINPGQMALGKLAIHEGVQLTYGSFPVFFSHPMKYFITPVKLTLGAVTLMLMKLNRDTWANEAVAQTISTNFIFWQVYDDTSEGRKVCTYYKLESIPVVLVIDPITGQKMHSWCGMVQPESLLEDLVPFMDGGPRDHQMHLSHKRPRGSSLTPPKSKCKLRFLIFSLMQLKLDNCCTMLGNNLFGLYCQYTVVSVHKTNVEEEQVLQPLVASVESMKDTSSCAVSSTKDATATEEETCPTGKPIYLPLPEEPRGDKSLLCRIGVRLPDGRRVQRNFLKTDPIQLLWSFCYSLLEDASSRSFHLTQAIPGAKSLDYCTKLTFEESGLANSIILVAWE
ncbi:hypothetical protein Tsubulata_007946 [Turnera subulata]|uniref:UBX domain-containing protein n=1 Tax=Turnera subulata TaxID=218843 RepID=A0A9Q0JHM9_9ROSI|nr:hypothetical protein Tsubulata_007946 [Turnera subulata]